MLSTLNKIIDAKAQEMKLAMQTALQQALLAPTNGPATKKESKAAAPRPTVKPIKEPPKRVAIPHCIAPECRKAHKGPRFSFLCAEHHASSTEHDRQDWSKAAKAKRTT